jgi:hypothetical protein
MSFASLHSSLDLLMFSLTMPMKQTAPFFHRGFGQPARLHELYKLRSERAVQLKLLQNRPSVTWLPRDERTLSGCRVQYLQFESPAAALLPSESRLSTFMLVTPPERHGDARGSGTPLVCLMPPTADFTFAARLHFLGVPLAKRGIASLIPMIPFYADRKPPEQFRACLLTVGDLFSLGAGVVSETAGLFNLFGDEGRFSAFGVSGYSLGGYLAAQVALVVDRELACVPIVVPRSATAVFTRGVLSRVVDFAGDMRAEVLDPARRQLILDAVELQEKDFVFPRSVFSGGVEADQWSVSKIVRTHFSPLLSDWLLRAPPPPAELRETMYVFANVLEHMTNLGAFNSPKRPEAMINVVARHDRYVPHDEHLEGAWPGSTVRYLNSGHVSTLFYQQRLVDTIVESFARLADGSRATPPAPQQPPQQQR